MYDFDLYRTSIVHEESMKRLFESGGTTTAQIQNGKKKVLTTETSDTLRPSEIILMKYLKFVK